jgi:integrase
MEAAMFLNRRSNGYYYVHYRDAKGIWRSISTRLTDEASAREFMSRFVPSNGKLTSPQRLSDFMPPFLEYSITNHAPATTSRFKFAYDSFIKIIGDRALTEYRPFDIEAYKSRRAKSVLPTSVNVDLRMLKAMFSVAVKWDLLEKSPFKGVRLMRIPEQRPMFFTREQFSQFLAAIDREWLRNLVLFAVNTGLRRSELVNLRWEDIDLIAKLVVVRNREGFSTKSRRERTVPLNRSAIAALESQSSQIDHVFKDPWQRPLKKDYVTRWFGRTVIVAELDRRLHFHHLRHTFASWLVQAGAGIYEVQKLLGHSSVAVTQVYAHLAPSELHATVGKIDIDLG